MTKLDRSYESHLVVQELCIPPGGEWNPRLSGWALIQIASGTGYWLHPSVNQELGAGTVLLLAPGSHGAIRASRLGTIDIGFFPIEPERLTGLITVNDKRFFANARSGEDLALQIFPAAHPVAVKMKALWAERNRSGSIFRLQLIQLFLEIFESRLDQGSVRPESTLDARERLATFLTQTPAAELLHLNFSELARMTRCTPRHLSRIFREVAGTSFRDKHTELRLARARELLATTESKVVDVALESGYQSLSLFNLVFTRHFGMSPGKWRQKNRGEKAPVRNRRKVLCLLPG